MIVAFYFDLEAFTPNHTSRYIFPFSRALTIGFVFYLLRLKIIVIIKIFKFSRNSSFNNHQT